MNEEEKKAVELLEHCQNTYIEDTLVTRLQLTIEEAKILLNLIKKQQKEIEERLEEIDSLYKMMSAKDDKIEQMEEDYQILKDDIEGHRIAYVDTPGFEENYISKDKIKEKIEEYENRKSNITQIIFSKYGRTHKTYKQAVYNEIIRVLKELLGETND